ncbi:phage tail protein [Serratia marcescens]|uniref:phage tail-collar fiber domain-containing protein n=1 Tax=Serratia marcescens TaxID=615 RepID=UPI001BAFE217|nr:phage tail protein [Serratia marcescens]MBS3892287.1 phage tail protein [Serratia marcescens]
MAKQFQSIVTDGGKALIATAIKGGSTINITQLAIGDGNGKPVTPHHDQTALVHEVLRLDVNAIKQNGTTDNQVVAQAVIPASQGGFYIREVGLFTAQGTLLAVSQFPETYKPSDQEGAGSTLVVSMTIAVADTSAITLTVDNTLVMATEAYVDDAIEAHAKSRNHPDATTSAKGLVQLSSATNSTSETLAATPKAVKAVYDVATKALPVHQAPLAVDLNTLGATSQAGVYCQTKNAGATDEYHYPIKLAGSLRLTPSAYGCQQEYTEYTAGRKFVRDLIGAWNGKDGPWGDWREYYSENHLPPSYGWGMGPQHRDDAYNNVAMVYRVNGASANAPGPNVYGVINLPCDGGPSTAYLAVQNSGRAFFGYSSLPEKGITWAEAYTTKNPPTAAGINAADVRNNFAARMGVARVLTGAGLPTSPGVWSVENSSWAGTTWGSLLCATNGSDLSTTPGNQKFIQYLQITHEMGGKAGLRVAANINGTFSGWDRAMMASGGTFNGPITVPYMASSPNVMPEGAGAYADQLNLKAPFFQPNWQWPVNAGGLFVPIAKGTSTRKDRGYPGAVSFGYLMPANDEHPHPTIHVKGDSNVDTAWDFNPYSGKISSKAGTFATEEWVNTHCPFPVGYVMLLGNNTDPRAVYPGTDWQDLNGTYDGRVLSLGCDPLGTGGSNQVTLGVEHLPPHSHNLKAYHSNTSLDGGSSNRYSVDPSNGAEAGDAITSTGGGQSFNVTNAYVHVRGWMRTA